MSIFTNLQSYLSIRIVELRTEKGWSQITLAEKLKTSRSQICRLEFSDQCKPSIQTLVKLAKIFRKDLVIEFADRD